MEYILALLFILFIGLVAFGAGRWYNRSKNQVIRMTAIGALVFVISGPVGFAGSFLLAGYSMERLEEQVAYVWNFSADEEALKNGRQSLETAQKAFELDKRRLETEKQNFEYRKEREQSKIIAEREALDKEIEKVYSSSFYKNITDREKQLSEREAELEKAVQVFCASASVSSASRQYCRQ